MEPKIYINSYLYITFKKSNYFFQFVVVFEKTVFLRILLANFLQKKSLAKNEMQEKVVYIALENIKTNGDADHLEKESMQLVCAHLHGK